MGDGSDFLTKNNYYFNEGNFCVNFFMDEIQGKSFQPFCKNTFA